MADVQFTRLLARLGLNTDQFERQMRSTERFARQSVRRIGRLTSRLSLPAGLSAGLLGAQFVRNTVAQEDAVQKLSQAIVTTGRVGRISASGVERFAAGVQKLTNFGDEAVIELVAFQLQFRNISEKILPRATRAILDFASFTGRDATQSAKLFGVALNDPVAGMGRLSQAGVSLDKSLKETIKNLAESGRLAEAQAIFLRELEKSFGGAARAARNTLGGALMSLKNAAGDLLEQDAILGVRVEIEKLTSRLQSPEFRNAANVIGERMVQAFNALSAAAQLAGENIGAASVALGALIGLAVTGGNPIGALAGGIIALIADAGVKSGQLERTTERTQAALKRLAQSTGPALETARLAAEGQLAIARKALEAAQKRLQNTPTEASTQLGISPVAARNAKRDVDALTGAVIALEGALSALQGKGGPGFGGISVGANAAAGALGSVNIEADKARKSIGDIITGLDDRILSLKTDEFAVELVQLTRTINGFVEQGAISAAEAADAIDAVSAKLDELRDKTAAQDAAKKAAEEAARLAEANRRAIEAPFLNAAENIQRAFGDTFTEIFRRGIDSFDDLKDRVKDIFARLAGEITNLLVFRPVLQAVAGGAGGGGGLLELLGLGGAGGVVGQRDNSAEKTGEAVERGAEAGTRSGVSSLLDVLGGLTRGGGGFVQVFGGGGGGGGLGGLLGSLGGGASSILGGLGSIATGASGGLLLSALGFSDSISIGGGIGGGLGAGLGLLLNSVSFAGATGVGAGLVSSSLLGSSLGALLGSYALPVIGTIIGAAIGAIPGAVGTIQDTNFSFGSGGIDFDNIQRGNRSQTAAFRDTYLQTLSFEFAVAAAIGAGERLPRQFLTTSTGGPGGLEGPFGNVAVSSTFGSGFAETIVALDRLVASASTADEIARLTGLAQSTDFGSVIERRPEDFLAGFASVIENRATTFLAELEGPNVAAAFQRTLGPLIPPVEGTFQVLQSFLRARGEFSGELRVLSGEEISQLEVDLARIDEALAEATQKFAPFGFEIQKLVDAADEGRRKLANDFLRDIQNEILRFSDPVAAALADQAIAAEQRLTTARIAEAEGALGAIADAERLNALERARIIEQAGQPLQDLLDSLTGSTSSPLAIGEVLANAESAFADVLARVQGGELGAAGELTQAATTLLDVSREAFGGTSLFFERFNFVVASLENVLGSLPAFATGGSFAVPGPGGTDSRLVAFWATPGELVTVSTPGQAAARGLRGFQNGGSFRVSSASSASPGAGLFSGDATTGRDSRALVDAVERNVAVDREVGVRLIEKVTELIAEVRESNEEAARMRRVGVAARARR